MKTEMRKETFWNRERVARNISYKELTELLGGSVAGWGGRFSGQLMPKPLEIKHLCELFDIDLEKGTEEFKKAHALWKAERHKTQVAITGTMENMSHKRKNEEVDPFKKPKEVAERIAKRITPTFDLFIGNEEAEEAEEEQPVIDIAEVLKSVYGKLPYELFMTFRAMLKDTKKDPLECLYGRISYNEFLQIQRALKNEDEEVRNL